MIKIIEARATAPLKRCNEEGPQNSHGRQPWRVYEPLHEYSGGDSSAPAERGEQHNIKGHGWIE